MHVNVLLYIVQLEGGAAVRVSRRLLSSPTALSAAHWRSQRLSNAVSRNQGVEVVAALSVWSPGLKPSLAEMGLLRAEVTAGFNS